MAKPNLSIVEDIKSKASRKPENEKTPNVKPKGKSSDDLAKLARTSFSSCKTDLEKLEQIQGLLESILPIAEGLYREYPTPSNSYALTNLIDKFQSISEQIEESVDIDALVQECMIETVQPFCDGLVLELGKLFKSELQSISANSSTSTKKVVKASFDAIFKSYGAVMSTKLPELRQNIKEYME